MDAKIVDKNLVITLPLETPHASASGKTMVVATTRGNRETNAKIEGKNIVIGVNAYFKK